MLMKELEDKIIELMVLRITYIAGSSKCTIKIFENLDLIDLNHEIFITRQVGQ